MGMDPRIHVITLAVNDLDRALEFYRDGLGLDSAAWSLPSSPVMSQPPPGRS
jgi:predicted enzyme related to lactoylglutathione lyase